MPQNIEPLEGAKWAASILNRTTYRIYQLCRADLIPHVRIGRTVFFDPPVFREFIKSGGCRHADEKDAPSGS